MALDAQDPFADNLRLAAKLLDPRAARSAEVARILDTASAEVLDPANLLNDWPDSSETAVRLYRVIASRPRAASPRWRDPAYVRRYLAEELAFRGHMREAFRVAAADFLTTDAIAKALPAWALLGAVRPDTAHALFHSWLTDVDLAPLALPWWGAQSDTVSLRKVVALMADRMRDARTEVEHERAAYWRDAAQAYFAVAKRDTAGAMRLLRGLSDSWCVRCSTAPQYLLLARLLHARADDAQAAQLLEADYHWSIRPIIVLWRLERARVNERLGRRELAMNEYQFVADVWRDADGQLQAYVDEARTALRRLEQSHR